MNNLPKTNSTCDTAIVSADHFDGVRLSEQLAESGYRTANMICANDIDVSAFTNQPALLIWQPKATSFENVLRSVKIFKEQSPQTLIIILGMTLDMHEGCILTRYAMGVVCGDRITINELARVMVAIKSGYTYIKGCKPKARTLTTKINSPCFSRNRPLTDREQQVLGLVTRGFQNGEIAEKLSLSKETVKSHVRSLLDKFAVADRTKLTVSALSPQNSVSLHQPRIAV